MNINTLCLLILSVFYLNPAKAQLNLIRNSTIVVLKTNGDTLKNPWTGGFNSVQFSEIDLNLDGIKDLITFGKTGNRLSPFINNGQPNVISYKHAPEYAKNFPEIKNWVLLRDYNCDGKMDIFTSSNGGIRIYKNTSINTLSFTIIDSLLLSNIQPDSTPLYSPIFVLSSDLPAIDDIDNDGDLDILTFNPAGNYVEYYKNVSIENYGNCDSLNFKLSNKCWGFFKENLNNSITLSDTCVNNINNPESGKKHAGSTLLTMDVDSNGTKELILGDVSYNNLTLLYNSDTSQSLTSSFINSTDTTFPANQISTPAVNINIFPAGFYIDVNNDSIKDLIISPNCIAGCKDKENVWLYKNTNANNNPIFDYLTDAFLQDGFIEVGQNAFPSFFDYNSDGLLDIVIGNYGVYDSANPLSYSSSLWLYENIGTLNNPSFKLVNSDYANISSYNLDLLGNKPTLRLTPTFGDLDNDGDQDMIIGDHNGHLHYFENNALQGNPANFILNQVNYSNIDVGNNAAPQLIDLNRDLLLDLVIGTRAGSFTYYQNTGTSNSPIFSFTTDSLGYINTKRDKDFFGYSMPYVYEESGTYKMLSGSISGYIYNFGNIEGNLTGTFSVDSSFQNIWEGATSSVNLADINNDGKLDLLVGNYDGGIACYQGNNQTNIIDINPLKTLSKIKVFPKPTKDYLTIDLGLNDIRNSTIEIYSLFGHRMLFKKINTKVSKLNISDFSQGIYLLKFKNKFSSSTYKIMKK